MSVLASKAELSYTTTSLGLDSPLRDDGRGLLDYRPIRISTGIYSQANGSARVQCGESQVIVGVTCSVTTLNGNYRETDKSLNGAIVCNVTW
jgi:exosome complex component RRP42